MTTLYWEIPSSLVYLGKGYPERRCMSSEGHRTFFPDNIWINNTRVHFRSPYIRSRQNCISQWEETLHMYFLLSLAEIILLWFAVEYINGPRRVRNHLTYFPIRKSVYVASSFVNVHFYNSQKEIHDSNILCNNEIRMTSNKQQDGSLEQNRYTIISETNIDSEVIVFFLM